MTENEKPPKAPQELTPDTLLDRHQTAAALTTRGYRTAYGTLAAKAVRGGGPPFRCFGFKPLYRWGDALAWAESRTTKPVRSNAERRQLERR